jgi:nucleoside-diphosphate-sugar epimerase
MTCNKVIVTGGSGFIGTNLIELLEKSNYEIKNYDIAKPKNLNHISYWIDIDILDSKRLFEQLLYDNPDYIIHLAARTDLNESVDIKGYSANFDGVRNLMESIKQLQGFKKVIIASSMLVCKLGYTPKSFNDYAPNSVYGESKVLTEKIVKEYDLNWTIVRPTSIWGPWFGVPYKNFFELVVRGLYFNIPAKYASTKTYGYVENSCMQIIKLLMSEDLSVKHNYFYLGDIEPINITDWAVRIRRLNNQSHPLTLPKWLLMFAAKIGDFLKFKLRITRFPMNSFRYNNMTNNNIIKDLQRTIDVTQIGADTNLENEILKTLDWLKLNK